MSTEKDNRSIGYLLKQTQHALRLQMDEGLKALHLTTPQYAVLFQLKMNPGISNAELARLSFITAQTMHPIVMNLEKNGLIQKRKEAHSGRVLFIDLTKKGEQTLLKAQEKMKEAEEKMMRMLSPARRDVLKETLKECMKALKG